jgi:hypothetical protein
VVKIESKSGKWALYGDPDAQIIVCGHSHAASILEAVMLPEFQAKSDSTIAVCYSSDWSLGPPGDKEYWDFVSDLSRGRHVVIAWNGNQHNANFMFQTEPKFTIIGATNESEDTVPIPLAMIKDFFKPSFEELTEIIPSMSNSKTVTLLNGPAPKPLTHIQNCILNDGYFTNIAKALESDLADLTITSDSLRLELWNLLAGLLEKYADDLGVDFLGVPAESRDISGMLLPEYRAPDVTHANSTYGKLLIGELEKLSGRVSN